MSNVFDVIARHRDRDAARTAIRHPAGDFSYGELCHEALRAADRLRDLGVRRDDRVLLAAPSVPEFVLVYFAIQALGAVVIPVNPVAVADEVTHIIADAAPRVLVHWQDVAPGACAAAEAAGIATWRLGPWERSSAAPEAVPVPREPSEVAAILYTSGTTGRPKGVMLTIGNVRAAGEICAALSEGDEQERIGTALPLFHIFGQSSVMMLAFTLGGSLSLLPAFDPTAMLDMIVRDRLTIVCGVPAMWNAMIQVPTAYTAADFESLRIAVSGGSPLPSAIAQAFEERFGARLLDGYGLTESTSIATFSRLDRTRAEGFTGPAAPRIEVRVVDASGRPLPTGETGEVLVKSPTVMLGYLNKPEATSEVLSPDGWLRTGDLGLFNADGDLRIVDRSKDLIIRSGYNVYPAEVESIFYQHPAVLEAAVIGYPDGRLGERVAAVIALKRQEQAPSAAELRAWAEERLSYYKVPSVVYFVDSLPKSSTGKILKRNIVLSELADANTER